MISRLPEVWSSEHQSWPEFRILGAINVRLGSRKMTLGGAKQRTVLAALLLANGRVVPDERFVSLLWGSAPPNTVQAQVYTYVSRLRRQFGDRVDIVRSGQGYAMPLGSARFDYAEFRRLSQAGLNRLAARNYSVAADDLADALKLWTGPALADVTPFLAREELNGIEEAHLTALEGRIEADLALARHADIISELFGLTARYALRERFRAQLMIALYRCGRQTDALAVYHEGRRILAEELGVDPDLLLQQTYHRILVADPQLRHPDGRTDVALLG